MRPSKAQKNIMDRQCFEIKALMEHQESRRVLWEILSHCEVLVANTGDTEFKAGIAEGRRRVGLYILSKVKILSPELVVKWEREQAAIDTADKDNVFNSMEV